MEDDMLNALVGAAARGDRAAFAELYRLTSARLYGIACRIMVGEADAQDVLQETYLRVWRKAAQFDARRGPAAAWLAGVLRHACIDRLRTQQRARANEAVPLLAEEAVVPGVQGTLDVARCFARLSDAERLAVSLAACQGYSHTEISETLGWPAGTVKSHIRRGLLKLRYCLEHGEREMAGASAADVVHG